MNGIDWINTVVGKPWKDRASGPNAFDCWGLVVDSFRRMDGVELADVTGYEEGQPIESIGSPVRDSYGWTEIPKPKDKAVFCIFLSNGDMVHVGRVVEAGGILYAVHAAGKGGKGQVAVEPIRTVIDRYLDRIKFYMRPTNG